MDPPVPASVLQALDAAEADLRLLTFKYAAVVAAIEKRRAAEGKLGDDGSDRRNVVVGADDTAGVEKVGTRLGQRARSTRAYQLTFT